MVAVIRWDTAQAARHYWTDGMFTLEASFELIRIRGG